MMNDMGDDSKVIKESGLSDKDMNDLRESFVDKYANLKGWDKANLSSEQLNEIQTQDGFKNPGLLLS